MQKEVKEKNNHHKVKKKEKRNQLEEEEDEFVEEEKCDLDSLEKVEKTSIYDEGDSKQIMVQKDNYILPDLWESLECKIFAFLHIFTFLEFLKFIIFVNL